MLFIFCYKSIGQRSSYRFDNSLCQLLLFYIHTSFREETVMGNVKITEDKYNEMVELYKNGLLQREIAEIYGVGRMTVNAILKKCGASEWGTSFKSRKVIFLESEEKDICDMYLSGVSSVKIGKQFGCDHKTITKVLDKYDIDRTGVGLRCYELNEHYFDDIDTPNKAYILGFFYADGSNNEEKQTISMSLQEEDKYILETIRKEIHSEKPLEFLDYSNKHDGGYNYKNQYRLLMFSKHMSQVLHDKGMPQNKSLILQWPMFLQDDLIPHFLRGYIDGDGHLRKVGHFVSLVSTEAFCNSAKGYLENKLGIECRVVDAPCHNGITRQLMVSKKENTKPFLDYIYQDAEIYLQRKYQIYYEKYINNAQMA